MKFIIYIFTISIFLISCNKTQLEPQDTSSNEVVIENEVVKLSNVIEKNGRLIFQNQEAFNNSLSILFERQENLSFLQTQFPNFISNRTAFNNLTEEEIENDITSHKSYVTLVKHSDELYVEPVIDEDLVAQIVNKEGLLQIGEDVYGFHYDVIYKFKEKDISNYINGNLEGFDELPIERKIHNARTVIFDCEKEYVSNLRTKKVRGEIKSIQTPIYASIVGVTTNYRRRSRWWSREDVNRIKINGEVDADRGWGTSGNLTHVTVDLNKSGTNESRISKTGIVASVGFYFTNFTADTEHSVKQSSSSSFETCFND